jgi:hypothetical protein
MLYIFIIDMQFLYQTHFFARIIIWPHRHSTARALNQEAHIFTGDRLQADEPKGLARLDARRENLDCRRFQMRGAEASALCTGS